MYNKELARLVNLGLAPKEIEMRMISFYLNETDQVLPDAPSIDF